MNYVDIGVRCDRHVGEVFPPRCPVCAGLTAEYEAFKIPVRYIPGSECAEHCGYPLPCDLCRRIALAKVVTV